MLVLSSVGTKVSRIYLGVIITGLILAFFVPSATARIACLAPIIIGIVENLGIERKSRVAALLMVGAVQADTFWNHDSNGGRPKPCGRRIYANTDEYIC